MEGYSQNSSLLQLFDDKSTEVVLYPDKFPDESPTLEVEIRLGYKELKKRKQKKLNEKRKLKKAATKDAPKICKMVFPAPRKFPGCRHNETIIIDREILNPDEHLRLLATPRQKPKPQYVRFIQKTLPPTTNHILTLAQPKANYVKETIELHSENLSPNQIKKMHDRLHGRNFLSIAESRQFARQQKKDEIHRLHYQQRQERRLKKKMMRLELGYLRDLMKQVYRKNRNYLLSEGETPLHNELATASEIILTKLCKLTGENVPQRNNPNITDKYYHQLCDKVALWMWRIMLSAGVTFECTEKIQERPSAASSIFEDTTKLEINQSKCAEELIADSSTQDIVNMVLESIIHRTTFTFHDVDRRITLAGSVSQTMLRGAPSEETTGTERAKGSKVNFMPRTSSSFAADQIIDSNEDTKKDME